jgi:holo-[acyl-carrier protein] synthase
VPLRGLGVDLVEVGRVADLLARHPRFAERCFTPAEQEYAFGHTGPEQRLAARFAGKEAVMKALGCGWRQVGWRDVEITGGGAPRVVLRGRAAARAEALGVGKVLLSLSHTDQLAVAAAVAVGPGLPSPA